MESCSYSCLPYCPGPMLLYRQATPEQPPCVEEELDEEGSTGTGGKGRVPVLALRPGKSLTGNLRRGHLWGQQDDAWLEELQEEIRIANARQSRKSSYMKVMGNAGLLTYSPMLPLLLVGPNIAKAAR